MFVRKTGRFPFTGTGDVNTYALFAEHFARLARTPNVSETVQGTADDFVDSTHLGPTSRGTRRCHRTHGHCDRQFDQCIFRESSVP